MLTSAHTPASVVDDVLVKVILLGARAKAALTGSGLDTGGGFQRLQKPSTLDKICVTQPVEPVPVSQAPEHLNAP